MFTAHSKTKSVFEVRFWSKKSELNEQSGYARKHNAPYAKQRWRVRSEVLCAIFVNSWQQWRVSQNDLAPNHGRRHVDMLAIERADVGSETLQRASVVRSAESVAMMMLAAVRAGMFVVTMIVMHLVAAASGGEHAHTVFGARLAAVVSHIKSAARHKEIRRQRKANNMSNEMLHRRKTPQN